jgi:hypothetical protein
VIGIGAVQPIEEQEISEVKDAAPVCEKSKWPALEQRVRPRAWKKVRAPSPGPS